MKQRLYWLLESICFIPLMKGYETLSVLHNCICANLPGYKECVCSVSSSYYYYCYYSFFLSFFLPPKVYPTHFSATTERKSMKLHMYSIGGQNQASELL